MRSTRIVLALAVLVLLAGATTSYGQFTAGSSVSYSITPGPGPQIRSQGITEATGDINLSTAPPPAGQTITGTAGGFNVTDIVGVTYNANITNAQTTPTTLTINGAVAPAVGGTTALGAGVTSFTCGPLNAAGTGMGVGPTGTANAVTGIGTAAAGSATSVTLSASGISVTFTNLQCPGANGTGVQTTIGWNVTGTSLTVSFTLASTAGTAASVTFNNGGGLQTGVTIHGVRVNASGVTTTNLITGTLFAPIPGNLANPAASVVQVALIAPGLDSSSGLYTSTSTPFPAIPGFFTINSSAGAAQAALGLTAGGNVNTSLTVCSIGKNTATGGSYPAAGASAGNPIFFVVREGFVGAFTTAGQEITRSGAEITNGTRVQLMFTSGLPSQLNIFAPQAVVNGNLTLALVNGGAALCGSTAACTAVLAGSTTAQTFQNQTTNFASAGPTTPLVIEYEVVNSAPSGGTPSAITIPLFVFHNGTTPDVTSAITTAVQLSPVSTVTTQSSNTTANPIVRFIAAPVAGGSFKTTACITALLFPYVANKAGFDTGLAISNMGQDNKGTSSQVGSCTLTFWDGTTTGTTPVFTTTLGPVNPGQTVTALASVIAGTAGFSGYGVAKCNFQFAHGFAIVVNGYGSAGAPTVGTAYLALVSPDTRGVVGGVETLGN